MIDALESCDGFILPANGCEHENNDRMLMGALSLLWPGEILSNNKINTIYEGGPVCVPP